MYELYHTVHSLIDSGKWTVPERSGSVFPPSAYISINVLPGNRAILFGGANINEQKQILRKNDVFIMCYTSKSVVSYLESFIIIFLLIFVKLFTI